MHIVKKRVKRFDSRCNVNIIFFVFFSATCEITSYYGACTCIMCNTIIHPRRPFDVGTY